jgi:glycosyltransferase involved in cell wall biosynthesis
VDVDRARPAKASKLTRPMRTLERVGINAVFLRPRMGGLETYVRRVVPELVALRPDVRFAVFLNQEGAAYLKREEWFGEVEVVTHSLLGRRWFCAASELALLGELARRRRIDVLHSVAMTGPLVVSAAHVVMVGDLIWLHDPGSTGRLTATLWKTVVPPVARRADRVLTFSEATRTDLVEQLGLARERIDVVPLGPGAAEAVEPTPPDEVRRRLDLGSGRVILAVSAKRTHKNLLRLVRALGLARRHVEEAVLVLVGNPTQHEEELKAETARLGLSDAVRFPAYVDASELEGLYRTASVVVFPSLREGFGLPVLEAMRRGVPVACSSTSSLPEVGGDAVRYFDPLDEQEIAAALVDLLTNRRLAEELAAKGHMRAQEFTWRRTAEGTLETYERSWSSRAAPA